MRVHQVKKARKAIPHAGIEVGDSYYWWKFRRGGKQVSKTYPKRQQLTQSDFLSQAYDLDDRVGDFNVEDAIHAATDDQLEERVDFESARNALQDHLSEIAQEIRDLGEEQRDKVQNMPESLQYGPTGELLEERAEQCEEWADYLEGVPVDEPSWDDFEGEDDAQDDYRQACIDAIQDALNDAEGAMPF